MTLRKKTVAMLVKDTGLTKAGIGLVLKGTTQAETIRATTIDRLAEALNVNRSWLLYGRGPVGEAELRPTSQVSGLDAGRLRDAKKVLQFLDDFLESPAGLWADEVAVKAVYDYLAALDGGPVDDGNVVQVARQVIHDLRKELTNAPNPEPPTG